MITLSGIALSGRTWVRLAAVGTLAVALGLSACGRKGPLDPPPSATAPGAVAAPAVRPVQDQFAPPPPGGPSALREPQPGVGMNGKAVAPPPSGEHRPFILDWLVE